MSHSLEYAEVKKLNSGSILEGGTVLDLPWIEMR